MSSARLQILLQSDHLRRLVELGEADAELQSESVEEFLSRPLQQMAEA